MLIITVYRFSVQRIKALLQKGLNQNGLNQNGLDQNGLNQNGLNKQAYGEPGNGNEMEMKWKLETEMEKQCLVVLARFTCYPHLAVFVLLACSLVPGLCRPQYFCIGKYWGGSGWE